MVSRVYGRDIQYLVIFGVAVLVMNLCVNDSSAILVLGTSNKDLLVTTLYTGPESADPKVSSRCSFFSSMHF